MTLNEVIRAKQFAIETAIALRELANAPGFDDMAADLLKRADAVLRRARKLTPTQ